MCVNLYRLLVLYAFLLLEVDRFSTCFPLLMLTKSNVKRTLMGMGMGMGIGYGVGDGDSEGDAF